MSHTSPPIPATEPLDAVVVGAGMGGLSMLHRLREQGLRARAFEAGADVGGTWFFNRYPGARCDIQSQVYSFSLSPEIQREWVWSEKFAAQPEILRYLHFVADRLDLRRDIQLETRVASAHFDEESASWTVRTDRGDIVTARHVIMATGNLSAPNLPKIPGLDDFAGEVFHTARWPDAAVDFTGKRVGVIGTGSTGIQVIPIVAAQAAHLTVFQRTPNFSLPSGNRPLDAEAVADIQRRYPEIRAKSHAHFAGTGYVEAQPSAKTLSPEARIARDEAHWRQSGAHFLSGYPLMWYDKEENAMAASFIHSKIRETVKDPAVADLLCPTDHYVGTKRICLDNGYYATYNRDNVELVDLRSAPIERIEAAGVRTAQGLHELDCLVFATGFDAVTGALFDIDIRGAGGVRLKDRWQDGPQSCLSLMTAGFPNLFMMTGPLGPGPLTNYFVAVEHDSNWIADCIRHLDERGLRRIEATPAAQADWVAHVNEVADKSLFPTANSWFVGANIPGKPRSFMIYVGGFPAYRERCRQVAEQGYVGFELR